MATATRTMFEKHLKKVCKDKIIRKCAMEFFDDYCLYHQGDVFTREDFETLEINGIVTEQDVVVNLLKDRDFLLPEEVLTYLFTHFINKIVSFKSKDSDFSGSVSAMRREMTIEQFSVRDRLKKREQIYAKTSYLRSFGMTDKEFAAMIKKQKKAQKRELKAKRKELIEEIKAEIYERRKAIVYHEFGHVGQIRAFLNGKYIKTELSKEIQFRDGDACGVCHAKGIAPSNIEKAAENQIASYEMHGSYAMKDFYYNRGGLDDYFRDKMVVIGYEAISEYMNEEYSKMILRDFVEVQGEPYYSIGDFQRKKQPSGNVSYSQNYDIARLIQVAIGDINEKDLRFNGTRYFDRIENFNVSEETILSSKTTLHKAFHDAQEQELGDDIMLKILDRSVDSLDLVDLIGFAMGMYTNYSNAEQVIDIKVDCKLVVQNVLIEAIKNKLLQDLENENIVKDAKFFEKLNTNLEIIDSVILYPKGYMQYYKINDADQTKLDCEKVLTIDGCSVQSCASTYKHLSHMKTFSDLCKIAKNAMKSYGGKVENIEQKMTFFKTQLELEKKRYERIQLSIASEAKVRTIRERTVGNSLIKQRKNQSKNQEEIEEEIVSEIKLENSENDNWLDDLL